MPSQTLSVVSALPRFATPRPTGPTWGPSICRVMEMLGDTPMPWQEYGADLIGDLDDRGLPRWSLVLISVPRQAGKTTLTLGACVHRLLTGKNMRVWSTAQTGQKARGKWMELVEKIENDSFPLRELFSSKKAAGSEQLIVPKLGSKFSPHPPTEDSLHGDQSDLNFIDEGWVFDEAEAAALMQAIVPTQATRPGAQTVIVSTRGTAASTWFHGLVAKAKLPGSKIALLDYGIADGDNPNDLELVASAHPAYGYTVTMDSLVAAKDQLAPSEFARAYGNRETGSRDREIPLESWESAASLDTIPDGHPVTFGAAVDFDRTETAIVAAALVDGIPIIEVVDIRAGTGWGAARLRELVEEHGAPPPWVDAIGPGATLADELTLMGTPPVKFGVRELTAACADIWDRITAVDHDGVAAPTVRIRPHEALDIAAELVTKRRVGEAWAWGRRASAGSIATLEAATLALYGELHRPAPAIAPNIR